MLLAQVFGSAGAGRTLSGRPEDYNRNIRRLGMRFVTGIAVCLVLVSSAFGQIDATTLRAKYGEPIKNSVPLNSETFKVRNNITMVVNYGPSGQACRIELLPGQSVVGHAPPDGMTKQQVDEVLQEVVPPPMRGK